MVSIQAQAEELDKLSKMFTKVDLDKNGFLSMEEFEQFVSEHLESTFLDGFQPSWNELIEVLDFDRDGRIKYDEFITAAYDRQKLVNEENMNKAFAQLDKNNDGTITKEELQPIGVQFDEETWRKLIQDCDTD